MKYFNNISSYLYVHHTFFKCTTFVCENMNPWKKKFHANFERTNEASEFVIEVPNLIG
jgi:hypothetical protein